MVDIPRIQTFLGRTNSVCHEALDLRRDPLLHIDAILGVMFVKVALELRDRHFVRLFELTVVLALLLHRVIVQVHHPVFRLRVVLCARRAQVVLAVEKGTEGAAPRLLGDKAVAAHVEFPFVDQQRVLHVLLHDPTPLLRINTVRYLLCGVVDADAVSTIGLVPGLHEPDPLVFSLADGVVGTAPLCVLLVARAMFHDEGERHSPEGISTMGQVEVHDALPEACFRGEPIVALEMVMDTRRQHCLRCPL
mmetsp:Transcript_22333/g.47615  ORF Transcript_22333/g.47615 Transcript_22333/m.47615 type:complete len:249 (+) Transcript_22333:595-1341(+)